MAVKVSVIVPVWNRANLIERCLDSIIHQSNLPDEIIIVDNNSTDATPSVLNRWIDKNKDSHTRIISVTEKTPGACVARQRGLEEAKGDFVLFFDSDDAMHPDLIEKAVKRIEEDSKYDIVCWNCRLNLLDGKQKIPTVIKSDPWASHLVHSLLRTQGYMVRRSFLIEAGGWTKPISVWNDLELGFRLLINNPSISILDDVLVEVYSQEKSITGLGFSPREGEWEKTLDELDAINEEKQSDNQFRKINRLINYKRSILAAQYYREGNKRAAEKLINLIEKKCSGFETGMLKFSYYFTRYGIRGAWRIVSLLY